MKKWIILILAVLLCGIGTVPAYAAEIDTMPDGSFATAEELFQYWESTYPPQYPDYISGVWTDNGTSYPLTFAVTDDAAGRAGKQEILRLLADDDSVKFTKQTYSRNALWAAMEDVSQYLDQDLGLVGLGVYDMDNYVGVEILKSHKDNEATQDFLKEIRKRHGDVFHITYTDGYATYSTTLDLITDSAVEKDPTHAILWCGIIGIGLLGTAALIMVVRQRQRRAVAQSSAGTVTISGEKKLTVHETEQVIKGGESAPSDRLEEEILSRLKR